ncbi:MULTISPECIES: amidohydrolase family protein [Ramlibacter]|uniref:Amidohydrolase family protein n=1 Tax=Ramlibacter pinisoli TaxID=2682844 RepID=A0A6N8IZI1_9BURK|nr:amidohydrolase family protein [Ramlibacter sp. CGMCC 1.13660]MVQ32005.1 amidohydrolase family protein [Ramlibacter pinisoli]
MNTPLGIDGACDCHIHVFEETRPLAPTATFTPPHAPAPEYARVREALGLSRVVVVQPTGYAFDNDCTLQAMKTLGPGARGVCVVPHDTADAELQALHDVGVRGVRFMMLAGGVLPWEALAPTAARIAPFGWHINLQLDGHELPRHEALLRHLPCRLVIDHIGKFLGPVSTHSEGFASLRRLIDAGHAWVKLSAPYECSRAGPPGYDDIAPLVETLAAAHTERCLWASNWPHPNIHPTPSSQDLLAWALARMPGDAAQRRILVDNPALLYGF